LFIVFLVANVIDHPVVVVVVVVVVVDASVVVVSMTNQTFCIKILYEILQI
jgi:hypothetical protein